VARDDVRAWLEELEQSLTEETLGDAWLPLVVGAGRYLTFPDEDLRGSVRRALLLLATGGDPQRGLELDGRAVTALAAELERDDRTAGLLDELSEIQRTASDLPLVSRALASLSAEPELAWRSFAAALLAEELAED